VALVETVIDASAAVCYIRRERGWDNFPPYLPLGIMSVVNYAEVVQRLLRENANGETRAQALLDAGLLLIDADRDVAVAVAMLEGTTRQQGVSLADRFCLALAMSRKLPVLTADRPWDALGLPVEIKLLR
jgi:ribonuclease VapC